MNIIILGTVVTGCVLAAIIVITQEALKTYRHKMELKSGSTQTEEYKELAEEAIATQQKIAGELAELRKSVAAMEKMMREV